jgi:hypothetical protein
MRKKEIALIFALIACFSLLFSAGCFSGDEPETPCIEDTDGDGIPDDEDEYPNMPNWGLNLTYLDNTEMNPGEYKAKISSSTDYGVLLVDNTGVAEDTVDLEVISEPEGWSVSLDMGSVTLDNESIEVVVITYSVASGATGEEPVVIEGTSQNALLPTAYNITIYCVVDSTNSPVTKKGDKVSVDYEVWGESGTSLDSGTLPATAGEKYVGPLQNLGYIVGFYMGLIGMEKPGGVLGLLGTGETKQIKVPPQLAYGTDSDAHELGGQTLVFELTINSSS